MKKTLSAVTVMLLALLPVLSCSGPDETPQWNDGSRLWLSGAYSDTSLSWSPYGHVLLFSAQAVGATRIFGADGLTAPSERTFTNLDEYVGPLGAWSGEIGRIVYTAMNSEKMWGQIRSIAGNDISVTVHVHDSLPNAFPTYTAAADSILYCGMATGSWRFYMIPYNRTADSGEAPVMLTGFPEGDMLRPSYSPETGEWLLFQHRAEPSASWSIMITRPDGSDPQIIAPSSYNDIHPAWGPNDQWVAFSSNRTGSYQIYLASIDGAHLIQLTDDPADDLYPAWNPVNNWIAFSSNRISQDRFDIFSIDEPELP